MGMILCDNCKYDISQEPYEHCVACGARMATKQGLCVQCRMPYERAWCVTARRDHVETLINDYKFQNAKAAHRPLAELLDAYLPMFESDVKIVPIPTVRSHIRQRGYDHMLLIARHFARLRSMDIAAPLSRVTTAMQRGASARERAAQAKEAFECASVDPSVTYLLLDDVVTTGATLKYAAQTLRDAGATSVWVASITRQPLD